MALLSEPFLHVVPVAVARPEYDRRQLRNGIVHLGLGAFHRAHQALYTEAVIRQGDLRWGTVGVSVRDAAVPTVLNAQDLLYSVTERHGDVAHTRIVGSLREALYAPGALQRVLQAIADPQTAIVSTTVTEKGYSQNPATSDLDLDDPGIRHDLLHPDAPQTTLGLLAAGIRLRPSAAPLTLLCCDNMAGNGDTFRRLLLQFSELIDPTLARRIATDVAFPNGMVDRIVPAATPSSLQAVEALLGVRDQAAIVCEPFTQWVIEDRFAGARPAWETAGALLTDDVRPYQAMKLRLLNGTHSAIAYAGQLCGLETVADAMAHPLVGPFARRLMRDNLLATVRAPSGFDVTTYCTDLLHRFDNPQLAHRTQQIAMDGTQKVPVRWLPALRESLSIGAELPQLEQALALWLHYLCAGRDDSGRKLVISDPGAPALAARMQGAGDASGTVLAALAHKAVFGNDPWPEPFVARLAAHLAVLRRSGLAALLDCAGPGPAGKPPG